MLQISENKFSNDDVMKYVIGTLQWKLPRAPLAFNPALHVDHIKNKPLLWNNVSSFVHIKVAYADKIVGHTICISVIWI